VRGFVRRFFRAAPAVASAQDLGRFVASRAAFVAQRGTLDYCRARAGMGWQKLFEEAEFREALDLCRRAVFRPALLDVAETCQILLRHSVAEPAIIVDAFADCIAAATADPAFAGAADGETRALLQARLARALLAPPRMVVTLGEETIEAAMERLPFHPRIVRGDRDVIENGVKVALCGVYAELERTCRLPALVEDLRSLVVGPVGFEPTTRPL